MSNNYNNRASWYDENLYKQLLNKDFLEQFGSKAYASPVEGGYYAKLEQFNDGTASLSYYCGHLVGVSARRDPRNSLELPSSSPEAKKEAVKRKVYPPKLKGSIRRDNLARTRKTLERHVRNNVKSFKSFITLTFDPSRCEGVDVFENAEHYFNLWNKKLKMWASRHDVELLYVGVPEYQKNGNVHYHFLTNFTVDNGLLVRQPDSDFYLDVKGWDYGFSSAFLLSSTDEKFNCLKYILKYLYKDLDNRLFGHRKIKQCGLDKARRLVYFDNINGYNKQLKVLKLFCTYDVWGGFNKDTGEAYYMNYSFDLLNNLKIT